jgi:glycosyltransferase involved in cell wall biosynthesis
MVAAVGHSPESPERRCLIVIGSLTRGGAERQAILATTALGTAGVRAVLHVATPPFPLVDEARAAGVELDLPPPGEGNAGQLRRLVQAARLHGTGGVITFLAGPSTRFWTARAASAELRRLPWIMAERGNTRALRLLRSPLRALLHSRCLRAADRVAVNSAALGSNVISFVEAIGLKTAVVPNVLVPFQADPREAREAVRALVGRDGSGPILGTIGSFHADRNHELLAEAFALILRRHPAAHLVAVGRASGTGCDESAARFRARLRGLGIEDRVSIPGDVAGARRLLAGFDAVVLSSRLEGSSNALAEALAVGAAIAATPAGDAEQLASGAAAISDGWTPGALAEAIAAVVDAPEAWRARAALRGRQLLEERSPERVGARWRQLLEDAAASARRRVGAAAAPVA